MFAELRKTIDKELKRFITDIDRKFGLRSSAPLLKNGIADFIPRKGKRIRPILFILAYLGYTKRTRPDLNNIISASLSMELLHAFLLIHDDIIDRSDLRRGKPAMHKIYARELKKNGPGESLAIVTGDIIFSHAVNNLLNMNEDLSRKERALKIFTDAASSTGVGEFMDVVNDLKKLDNIGEKDIRATYKLKTSLYTFKAPLVAGAVLTKASEKEVSKLSALSLLLGEAFQITDDLLDIFSTSKKTGKPVFSDLKESKRTLLAWKTFSSLKGSDKRTFARIFKKTNKTAGGLEKLRKLMLLSGSYLYCHKRASRLFGAAMDIASTLSMKRKYKCAITDFIAEMQDKLNTLNIEQRSL